MTLGPSFEMAPIEFIKECIQTYIKNNGKAPTTLVANSKRIFNWFSTGTLDAVEKLNLKIISGDYLKDNEIDLCMGVKDNKKL